MDARDQRVLQFIYDRLVHVHKENPNYDYMHRLKAIIGDIPEPRPASSGQRGIMELREEHLTALNFMVKHAGRSFDIIPDGFKKNQLLAEEAVDIMKQVFGASSRDLITLYPTIG